MSLLTSAFRLRQAVVSGNKEVPEGTARHGFNDHHDIGRERHIHLLRNAVDELFSVEYLVARGLDRTEATRHNDLVTQALDVVLVRWEQLAVASNVVPERSEPIDDFLGLATGFSIEVSLRLAAYEVLYGYLHPFLNEVPSWLKGPKLKPWWRSIETRAGRPVKVSQFYKDHELESHTIRDIRDGKALLKEGTLPVLARRLAEHSVRDRHEERDAHPAEVEFELRVAVAVADQRKIVERFLTPRAHDGLVMQLHIFRHVLRGTPDGVAEDLLRLGTQGRSWPVVNRVYRAALIAQIVECAFQMKARMDRKMVADDPKRNTLDLANADADQVAYLRSLDRRLGADGPENRLAEHFENSRDIWLAIASDGRQPVREPRPELLAEMKADALCMEAMAPWLRLSEEEKEKCFREAVQVCDWSAYAHRSLGRHLGRVNKIEEAIQHLRRSVELNPENEEGREALALIHAKRGDYEVVLTLTSPKVSSPMLRAVRAYALLRTGDAAAAEKVARAVLDEHPCQTVALRVLADCLRSSGGKRKASELEMRADLFERGVRPPGG